MPSFVFALQFDSNVAGSNAAKEIENLAATFSKKSIQAIQVALLETEANILLKLDLTPYPKQTIDEVRSQLERTGG